MVDATDDVTLRILQDIQAKLADQARVLAEQGRKLDRLDGRFDELRNSTLYALGLGTAEHLKNREQDERLDDLFEQMKALLAKI